jgi:hypothetical protein
MTKMIGTIITRPTSKKSGKPTMIATSAIIHGSVRGVECLRMVETSRSAAPDSAISAPSIAPSAMMMPTSPSNAPAPLLKALATASNGRPAEKPAANVPTRIDRNGASFSTLMKTMISASPSTHDKIS